MRTLSTVLILDQFSTQQAGHVLRGYRGKRGADVVTKERDTSSAPESATLMRICS